MFASVIRATAETPRVSVARVSTRDRLYVVGDVHGRIDLLDALAKKIEDDLRRGDFDCAMSIFLGDYIDRGPHSAQVIERLSSNNFPTPLITLRGNHEAECLDFLKDANVLERWRRYGGLETLASYGVNVSSVMRGAGHEAARRDLVQLMPAHHVEFLQETRLCYANGDYFFCHAGVRPGVPLVEQTPQDLMWIRQSFTAYRGSFEKIIVHGHTAVEAPLLLPNRIALDTGAYATGRLTCLVLQGDERRFIST